MSNQNRPEPEREDFQNALKEIGTYVDITMEDLMQIHRIASEHARLRQTEQMFVKDLMTTDVATVQQETALKEAAQILLDRRISGLPVVDTDRRLVGIITEADFLTAMGIPCHHPSHSLWHTLESMFTHHPHTSNANSRVADIMAANVVCIGEDNTLHEVIATMKQHNIKRLVVTDEDNRVIGMITRSNLVRVLLQKML